MNIKKRTGVWVHGFHLQAEVWKEVVWGKPPDLLGRVPKAVLVALEEDAVLLGFGTGGSEINGKKDFPGFQPGSSAKVLKGLLCSS